MRKLVRLDGAEVSVRGALPFPIAPAVFAAYERDHAPRLRAEGLRLFPPEKRGDVTGRGLGGGGWAEFPL